MQNHNNTLSDAEVEVEVQAEPTEAPPPAWCGELRQLLKDAARVSAEHGVELDNFMRAAWGSYIEARPDMRAQMEEMQLLAQLEEVRKAGKMGEA